jgi:hypothetical protein
MGFVEEFRPLAQRAVTCSASSCIFTGRPAWVNSQQERTLIAYVNQLTGLGLPPTPSMLHNFAYDIAQKEPGKNWSRRFCQRWSDTLQSRYLKPIDNSRKKAESFEAFEYWFSLIASKIEQYGIEAQNIYNMDEKGFLTGSLTKAKRIFTKQWFENQQLLGNVRDGSREWITIIATICADGTALPPSLIYKLRPKLVISKTPGYKISNQIFIQHTSLPHRQAGPTTALDTSGSPRCSIDSANPKLIMVETGACLSWTAMAHMST